MWVRTIFDWYCIEGASLLAIAHRLTQEHVPTRNGGKWTQSTVRTILKQETYTGQYWWGKQDNTNG